MRSELFDFELPLERIALEPMVPRDRARLLIVRPNPEGSRPARASFADRVVSELPRLLRPGDALVLNDTRVIRAQLNKKDDRPESCCRNKTFIIEKRELERNHKVRQER